MDAYAPRRIVAVFISYKLISLVEKNLKNSPNYYNVFADRSDMKKSEKIIAAVLTMVVGVLLILMKDNFIGVLMSVIGLGLIVFGIVDIIENAVPPAVIKIVGGILTVICGWWVVEAVLYVLSAVLLICGILLLYDKIKRKVWCDTLVYTLCEYAAAVVCIAVGAVLLFHQNLTVNFIFITSGLLVLLEGGIMLFNIFSQED